MTNTQQILIKRHYLVSTAEQGDKKLAAYYSAFLFSNFGILTDKPYLLTKEMVNEIKDLYRLDVPASYFKNPQDMKYYTREELLIEQLVSYFFAYGAEDSHVKLFDKVLPEYDLGEEIKVRDFKILNAVEATQVLRSIMQDYCAYKRPWSEDEYNEFITLYEGAYYENYSILCADNALRLLPLDINFARFMYKKDLVKYSIYVCGERKQFDIPANILAVVRQALPLVMDCPMSKKQAKYFNTLTKKAGVKLTRKTSNFHSPYRIAKEALDAGDIYNAARIYAAHGSLLERNLKMLISRANPIEAAEIVKLIPNTNPIVLYQLMSTLTADDGNARTFTFTKNGLVRRHIETDYETKWRKSKLNDSTRKFLHDACMNQIKAGYEAQESLGKVYVSENFYKLGIPVNTSASGKGIDVLPLGSRMSITGDYIRTFVHWEKAFDIDSSLIVVDNEGKAQTMYFGNASSKPFGNSVLFSGDVTSPNGTEYYDIRLAEMKAKGYRYIISTFHGFCSNLNSGEIYCGYQNKDNLETKAWDPKNIELKIHVKGDTRAFLAFGIDLETNEIVIFNQLKDDDARVVRAEDLKLVLKYLDPAFLELNMGKVISYRGEAVTTPEEADVIFADDVKPAENQKVVRSWEVEKLVSISTGGTLN